MKEFIPQKIFYEPISKSYPLGNKLLQQYEKLNIPMVEIENHNNIEDLRKQPNSNFPTLKRCLIIGKRKTHKYTANHKVSDFLVPYTSSGCTAMCLYCYLVCSYNKCAYLRLFVNREEMLEKIIKKAQSFDTHQVFEIGSNSDLILENTLTGNLQWTIEEFCRQSSGKLTFPTKFNMIEPLLGLSHQNRVIIRISLNPEKIIQKIELGTSNLADRMAAINHLCADGYPVGVLIAPVIFTEDWKTIYLNLLQQMEANLNKKAKETIFFEVIFMTYSFIHDKINTEAFPNATNLLNKDIMTGRGRGKYWYKQPIREEGERYFREQISKYFPNNNILYIV